MSTRLVTSLFCMTIASATAITASASESKESAPEPAAATVGSPAPAFSLLDTDGQTRQLSDFKGKYVVLEWINHGCPFVRKHYESGNMQRLQQTYGEKGIVWLSICSSAEGKQGYYEPAEANRVTGEKGATPTALLLDPDGTVGKAYGAKTTPHMFIVNPDGTLIYQGAIDDIKSTKPDDVERAHNYVAAALDAALAGQPVPEGSTKAYGCGIKYKS